MTEDEILKQAAEIQAKRDAANEKRFSITIATEQRDVWSGTIEPRNMSFALTEGEARSIAYDIQRQFRMAGVPQ